MKKLSNGQLQDDFLQSLWLQRMPPHIQTVLSASSETLDKLAIIADKVSEVVGASSTICAATTVPPPSQSSLCSAQPTMDSLARQIQELCLTLPSQMMMLLSCKPGRPRDNTIRFTYTQRTFISINPLSGYLPPEKLFRKHFTLILLYPSKMQQTSILSPF
ncbi:uncharacterized protein TNCV_1890091 [Trichonephila clavipes]|nr:uncharacterized protein TNCV_1890091 [Trichonephila clavipes]